MADLNSSLASLLQVPGLQELLNNSITRQRELAPLRTAVTQQATNMLPNSAFTRPDIAAIPRANYSTPAPSGGGVDWTKILSLLAAGVAGGGALSKLLGGGSESGGNLRNIANGLKKLFGNGGSVQGNKPFPGGAMTGGGQPPQYPFTGFAGSEGPPPLLPSDPGVYYGESGAGAQPSDPSGGTGVGPGMRGFYGYGGDDDGGDGGGY